MDQPNFSKNCNVHKFQEISGTSVNTVFLGDSTSNSGETEKFLGTKQNYSPATTVLEKSKVFVLVLLAPALTNIDTAQPA